MAKLNIITLGSSKNYTNMVSLGLASVTVDDVNKSITFTLSADGSQHTIHFDQPSDGVSVTGISDKGNGKFTLLFSDGSESDEIQTVSGIKGDKGDPFKYSDFTPEQLESLKGADGVSPTITENADNTDKIYKLDITTADSTFTTPNLKGADGQGGTGGSGEENKIDSISVNGVNVVPDENKNVDIAVPSIDGLAKTEDIPTKVSELTNDSGYLTEHQDISGKVDKVEGKSLISDTEIARLASVYNYDDTDIKAEIANKADTTSIPRKVSELTNDSNYQTAEQVNNTVVTEIAKVVADAPEDLNTLKEMSDWIAGHENDASAMNSAISDNKTAITALQTGKADKSEIPTTLPANGGNSDTVNNHTVETDVPVNAVFTDTIYDDTEVKGSIAELNSNLVDQKMLGWTVPSECPVQNYIDSDGVFHQRVGRVDLGSLDWKYDSTINRFTTLLPGKFKPSNQSLNEWTRGLYCVLYEANPSPIVGDNVNMTISGYPDDEHLYLNNFSYTDVTSFKNAMKGVYLYYELATPITMNIDGNEAVTSRNESLDDYGLVNQFDGNLRQGYFNDNAVWTNATSDVTSNSLFTCKAGDVVTVKASKESNIYIKFFDSSDNMLQKANSTQTKEFTQKAPTNAVKFAFSLNYSNIKPSDFSHVWIYINNTIDEIKNDLGGLSFSASGTTLTITDGTNTWTLEANS